jgi:ADP-heptose:LPS heptosyltransferase
MAEAGSLFAMFQRLLIVRLSSIGDAIHTLPLAAALRRLRPGAFLGWLVEEPASPLIVNNPILDWWLVLPKGWLKKPSCLARLRRETRDQRFEVAFDAQGLSKSAAAALLSGAPLRVGFTRGEAREIAPLLDNRLIRPPGRHVVANTLGLIAALGETPPAEAELILPSCPGPELGLIQNFLAQPGLAKGFHLFGPWTSNISKCWPLEYFTDLAGRLRRATGRPSLALGYGPQEREAILQAAAKAPGDLWPAPEVTILGVAELIRRADLFVGGDSFALHTAAGLGRPTLGLFGVSDPARVGPHRAGGRSIHARLTLATSRRARARLPQDNLRALTVERVAAESLALLNRQPLPGEHP